MTAAGQHVVSEAGRGTDNGNSEILASSLRASRTMSEHLNIYISILGVSFCFNPIHFFQASHKATHEIQSMRVQMSCDHRYRTPVWQVTCQQQCDQPQSRTTCNGNYSSLKTKRRVSATILERLLALDAKGCRRKRRALRGMQKPQRQGGCGAGDVDNACTYLSIRCSPDAVSMTGEISPGFSANEASSNSFCMSPCPKNPL